MQGEIGMNFRSIVKGLIVVVRNIVLFFIGFIAFMWAIILILAMASSPYCLKSEVQIPDEAFAEAVSSWTQKNYTGDTEKIRKKLEASGLPADAAAILKWRKSGGNFYQGWSSQAPDFSGLACYKVERKPTERLFLYKLLGVRMLLLKLVPGIRMGG